MELKEIFISRFDDDFTIIKRLGKGGFGVVLEVYQKIDNCKYAIKRITIPKEKQALERVLREKSLLQNLNIPTL